MANNTATMFDHDRLSLGQNVALGDTGDGETGVPQAEQGIPNRPGDSNDHSDEDESDEDDSEEDDSDVSDPKAEPGKPI